MELLKQLLEFAPNDGGDRPSKGPTIFELTAAYLKSSGIDDAPEVKRPNYTQGVIKFKVRNSNKLLNKFDQYQVEIDYEENGNGYEHEWRIVQLKPYKTIAKKITGKQPDANSLIAKLKELFK